MAPALYLSLDPEILRAFEFGRIDDGQPDGTFERIGERVQLMRDLETSEVVGFRALVEDYDPDDGDNALLWDGPRFDVPQLGLTDATTNEVILATLALYGRGGRSLNRELFSQAIDTQGGDLDEQYAAWLAVLQAGDPMAHYALGYTLLDQERPQEAYRHLRHYSEIAPEDPWTWTYRARAAKALNQREDAIASYRTAIRLAREQDEPTDAEEELLELLGPSDRDERFADLVEELGRPMRLMSAGANHFALVDWPDVPVLVRLAADDVVTIAIELAHDMYPEDADEETLGPLLDLCRDEDHVRLNAEDNLWVERVVGPEPDLAALRSAVEELAGEAPQLIAAAQDAADDHPPLNYAEREDEGPW